MRHGGTGDGAKDLRGGTRSSPVVDGRGNWGLVTAAQLDHIGVGSPGAASGRRPAGALSRVRLGRLPPSRARRHTWPAAVMAAVLAAGPGAVASHWTAARLWRLFDGPIPPRRAVTRHIHVTTLRQRRLSGRRRRIAGGWTLGRAHHSIGASRSPQVARTLADLAERHRRRRPRASH